ncbi:L,D-transpeptidase family protein [Nostoc sp. NIES-2111]
MQAAARNSLRTDNALPPRSSPARAPRLLHVRRRPGQHSLGWLQAGALRWPCALGRGGVTRAKREGDGGTPAGLLRPLQGFWRPDRLRLPATALRFAPIRQDDGWCDAPGHPAYNRKVKLPFRASHEEMWRADGLYDVVIDLDWNRRPAIAGRGSAIFLHLARPDYAPTAGCIAVSPATMRRLVRLLTPRTRILVH